MTRGHLGHRRARHPDDLPPSDRELAIIQVAMSIPSGLPELHAAGRLFFRFDPGFRTELESARQEWHSSARPIDLSSMSDEQRFDIHADVSNNRGLRLIALRLATRWGLDLGSTINAVAFDTAPTYPVGQIRYSCIDAETGYHYAEIKVESAYVWQHIQSALADLAWIEPTRKLAWFWDRPKGSRHRLRGMNGRVAARTLALHFLSQSRAGKRLSGGTRRWQEALELWESTVPGEMAPLDPDAPTHWRRDRTYLLRFVVGRSADPVQLLMEAQREVGMGDQNWAARLGIDLNDWGQIRGEQRVSWIVWKQVRRFGPEVARAVDAYREVGLLKVVPER